MDPFVVFPAEWAAAGFEIHTTPPTLPFPSGYKSYAIEEPSRSPSLLRSSAE